MASHVGHWLLFSPIGVRERCRSSHGPVTVSRDPRRRTGQVAAQYSEQRPRSMHHRSLIRNSPLERTIHLMCDPASPPERARLFWVSGHNFKHDFLPITCPSHSHGLTNFSSAIWHVFYSFPISTRRSFLVTADWLSNKFPLDWLLKE